MNSGDNAGPECDRERRQLFAAGWHAACEQHSGLLFSHGVNDWTLGFEEAWQLYLARKIIHEDCDILRDLSKR
jgi:hypothetical protein